MSENGRRMIKISSTVCMAAAYHSLSGNILLFEVSWQECQEAPRGTIAIVAKIIGRGNMLIHMAEGNVYCHILTVCIIVLVLLMLLSDFVLV